MSYLTNAIRLAALAHADQVDKSGVAYILHPLRVMLSPTLTTEAERIVAVLHDVKEDHPEQWADWERYFVDVPGVLDGIDGITWRKGESWKAYLRRAKENPIARKVKLADLNDNLRPIPNPTKVDERRRQKYVDAALFLSRV